MQRLKFTLIPIFTGIVLAFFSWYVSYPVSIDSPYDFIYNHISTIYWLGSTILFASLFILAINTKNNILRWIITLGTVSLMYAPVYFYYMIPGPDSHAFRSLTEYYISTGDLSSKPYHQYYEWPLFFILNKAATSITGLDLRYFEFMLYGIIGFILATSLYLYTTKAGANGYISVVCFFIIQRYFFNYQWAPFSISMSLLFLLLALDTYTFKKREITLVMVIIFLSMTFTHAFVPVFFVIYELLRFITSKKQRHLTLFALTLVIYLVVLIFYATSHFPDLVNQLTSIYTLEYANRVEATLASSVASTPYVDVIAQNFSRTVFITTAIITAIGFTMLLIKRKFRNVDYAILLTGVLYSATGLLLPVLGTRGLTLAVIPASLGASYLMESRFKRSFKSVFLILIILFTFTLIHDSFYDRQIFFQTKKEHDCANFVIYNYNWRTPSILLSHFRFREYLSKRSCSEDVVFKEDTYSKNFLEDMKDYDCVVYTVGLGKSFLRLNYTIENSFFIFEINQFNLIYNSGDFSYLFLRNSSNTPVP